MMIHTETDNYSLLWLENAMTLPVGYPDQHYYLDVRTNNLFALVNMEENDCMVYVDRFYRELDVSAANELAERVAAADHKISQVFEIPRVTVDEKISLQLEFIAKLPQGSHISNLSEYVKQQPNDSSFVLDFVLSEDHKSALIAKYWEEYKLDTISRYINQFIKQPNSSHRLAVA